VRVWAVASGECLLTLTHFMSVHMLSTVLGFLVSSSFDGRIRVWDPVTGACVLTLFSGDGCLLGLPDGKLVTGSWSDLRVWE